MGSEHDIVETGSCLTGSQRDTLFGPERHTILVATQSAPLVPYSAESAAYVRYSLSPSVSQRNLPEYIGTQVPICDSSPHYMPHVPAEAQGDGDIDVHFTPPLVHHRPSPGSRQAQRPVVPAGSSLSFHSPTPAHALRLPISVTGSGRAREAPIQVQIPVQAQALPNAFHPLPALTDIPLLNGKNDFTSWDTLIRSILRCYGIFGHIAAPGYDPVDVYRPNTLPSYMPQIPPHPHATEEQVTTYRVWWDSDDIASYILLGRLGRLVRTSVPPNDNGAGFRTARGVYEFLRRAYGVTGDQLGSFR